MPPDLARWLLTLPRARPSRRPTSRSLSPCARSFQIASFVASLSPKPLGITAPPSFVSESLTLPGGAAVAGDRRAEEHSLTGEPQWRCQAKRAARRSALAPGGGDCP